MQKMLTSPKVVLFEDTGRTGNTNPVNLYATSVTEKKNIRRQPSAMIPGNNTDL
jgi:hypothetical protein